jgi:hypothetical protein
MYTWTHLLYVPLEGLDGRETKRCHVVLEELVADVTPLQGTDDMFGREWDLRDWESVVCPALPLLNEPLHTPR